MTVEMGQSVLAYFFISNRFTGRKKEVLRSKKLSATWNPTQRVYVKVMWFFGVSKHRQNIKETRTAMEEYLDV